MEDAFTHPHIMRDECRIRIETLEKIGALGEAAMRDGEVTKNRLSSLECKETSMGQDIKDIQNRLGSIENNISKMPSEMKAYFFQGVLYVIGSYLVGAMICFFIVGKVSNQVDVNTKRLDRVEATAWEVSSRSVEIK